MKKCNHTDACKEAWALGDCCPVCLSKQVGRLAQVLRALHDEQNGPPLVKRQKQWEAAMVEARKALLEAKR